MQIPSGVISGSASQHSNNSSKDLNPSRVINSQGPPAIASIYPRDLLRDELLLRRKNAGKYKKHKKNLQTAEERRFSGVGLVTSSLKCLSVSLSVYHCTLWVFHAGKKRVARRRRRRRAPLIVSLFAGCQWQSLCQFSNRMFKLNLQRSKWGN